MTLLDQSALKVAVIVGLSLASLMLLRHRSAAARHGVLAFALVCAAVTPLLEAFVPGWSVPWIEPAQTDMLERRMTDIRHVMGTTPGAGAERRALIVRLQRHDVIQTQTSWLDPGRLGAVLVPMWVAGMVVGFSSVLLGVAWLVRTTRRSRPLEEPRWLSACEAIAREYGVDRPVRLRQTDHPTLLVTWGWRRPTIMVPTSGRSWPDERVRVVLAHELSHIVRRDWLVQTAAALLRSVYWFNPLIWIACRRLRQESEQACDDMVLSRGVSAADYAAHLLDIARSFTRQQRVWSPAPAIARPSSLERRVSAMLDDRRSRRPMTWHGYAVAIAALVTATVPIAGFGNLPQGTAVLSGTVRDPGGLPAREVGIILTRLTGAMQLGVETDANGRFEFSGLPWGRYRVNSVVQGFEPFVVALDGGDRLHRDINLTFGPFREMWTIVTSGLRDAAARPGLPPEWRCASSGPPLCGPESMVEEFERDEQRRLATNPVLGPRRVMTQRIGSYQALRDADVEGTVTVEGRITTDGVFTGVRVVSAASRELERAVLAALASATWEPARLRGVPVEAPLTITIEVRREPRGARS
jgi:TonB family protein